MKPDQATIKGFQQWCGLGTAVLLAACSNMSEQERKAFLCEEWGRGTKNVDQLKATYSIATGKQFKLRSGGPRTGVSYIDGDLKQLAREVDTACDVQSIGLE
uniref:hypothetical protein n=1 Tax=Synechococcus sp. UW106 TaxID=368495 RepID=UPI001FCBC298|nr:hypothetical protein [Synechococcus sp. UW106]